MIPWGLKVVEAWLSNQVSIRLNSGAEIFAIPGTIEVTVGLLK